MERESGEIAEDREHEDTGGHHTSNLIKNHVKQNILMTNVNEYEEEIVDMMADQDIFVPHRSPLYESYDSIRHPEHC